jgi:hypothetical protein
VGLIPCLYGAGASAAPSVDVPPGNANAAILADAGTPLAKRRTTSPNDGKANADILDRLDAISAKLDRLEKVLGCPIDDYLAGTAGCEDKSPASVSVTYCISQGRSGELAGKWAAEFKSKVEGGAGWPNVLVAKLGGELNLPVYVFPTEIAVGGSASLGRNFDICVQIPLQAANADAGVIDRIVRGMNPSALDTKFQRRLTRLLSYADRRVPEPAPSAGAKSATIASADIDLDVVDDAMERFQAGQFQVPNGPLGLFNDPVIQDLRNALDLPEPVQQVLDDPEVLFEQLPSVSPSNPARMCDTLQLSGRIANRSPAVANLCNLLGSLPSYEVVSTAFDTVHRVNDLVENVPDEVVLGVGEILKEKVDDKLPAPKPGSTFCNIAGSVFKRLCKQ